MNNENSFKSNVKRWSLLFPEDAKKLEQLQCKYLTFTQTDAGEPNLQKKIKGKTQYYHSQINAAEEAREWFSKMDPIHHNVLYVYGVGLGYYYDAAKEWLKNEYHFLIFLEDDLEVIRRLFETEKGTEILRNKQVRIVHFERFNLMDSVWTYLCQTFALREYALSALEYYEKSFSDVLMQIKAALAFWSNVCTSSRVEYSTFGQHFFSNFYQNIVSLPEAYRGNALFGQFEGVPAIICGAGPSLSKNLDVLETLSDRALIFAGGSALNAINARGFLPHFGLGIDPNPAQVTRLIMNTAYETPFLYRHRLYQEALKLVQGPHLYVTGSGGYKISDWLEGQLGISGEFINEGLNVVNFSLALACAFGCNPIIFVGLDLAYTEGGSYYSGITSHPIHNRKRDFQTKTISEELLEKPDIYGKPVNTLWKWISESLWISQFAEMHPNILFINATEGGIGMRGIPNKPLQEVAEHLLIRKFDLFLRVHGEIQNSTMPELVTLEKIKQVFQEMAQSLERCELLCTSLCNASLALSEAIRKGHVNSDDLMTDEMQVILDKLIQEIGYIYILNDFDENYQPTTGLSQQQIVYDYYMSHSDGVAKKAVIQAERFKFLKNTALMNQALMQLYLFQQTTAFPNEKSVDLSESQCDGEYSFENGNLTIIDSELKLHIRDVLPKDKAISVDRIYYSDKTLKIEQNHCDGQAHGPMTYFGKDGTVLAKSWYVHGVQQGKTCFYYSDGKLYCCQKFLNGKRHGKQQYYYPGGNLKSILSYNNGVLNGDVVLYHSNGRMKRELHFVQGKRHGLERMWNDSGTLLLEAEYREGNPVGVARSWYQNGQLALCITFDQNCKARSVECWNSDGVPVHETQIQDDYFDTLAKETGVLTHSLEAIVEKLSSIAPLLYSESDEFQKTIQEDLTRLTQEIKSLEAMQAEMLKESGVETDGVKEPIWKSPSSRGQLQKQMAEITKNLVKEINQIQNVVSSAAKRLKQKIKDEKKTK